MRMPGWIVAAILGLLLSSSARAQEEMKISGRVMDADGKPVAEAVIATGWTQIARRAVPYQGASTDAQGRFTLSLIVGSQRIGLMARDKEDRTGGIVLLGKKPPEKPVEIKLVPLIRVKGRLFSKERNKPIPGGFLIFSNSTYVFRGEAPDGVISFRLPPGDYRLWTSVSGCERIDKVFTLEPGKPEKDFGDLDLSPSILVKHIGKTLPAWHVTDARGAKKDVKLSDYKGKWVLVEFWAYWCGPCVSGSLPRLIDLYEAHKKDRAKFEVLAIHNESVKDFAELEMKTERSRRRYWGGHDLPFPILLDANGQTIKDWGIHAFPTRLLIDPEGKLVGEVSEEDLAAKLPPLPASVRVARALDRNLPAFALHDRTLDYNVKLLARLTDVPVRLDLDSLKAAGIVPDAPVPLDMTTSITLRSALNLILEAFPLTFTANDNGVTIRTREAGTPPHHVSERQRAAVQRIETALNQKVSFAFKNKPLAEAARFLSRRIENETIMLSPRDRTAGRLDPKTPVSGSAKDVPAREALKMLLEPIGLTYTIRDEVIVLTAKRTTPGK